MELRNRSLMNRLVMAVMTAMLVHFGFKVSDLSLCTVLTPLEDTFISTGRWQGGLSPPVNDVFWLEPLQIHLLRKNLESKNHKELVLGDEPSSIHVIKPPESGTAYSNYVDNFICKHKFPNESHVVVDLKYKTKMHDHNRVILQSKVVSSATDSRSPSKILLNAVDEVGAEGAPVEQPSFIEQPVIFRQGQCSVHKLPVNEPRHRCKKKVHIFSSMSRLIPVPELKHFRALLQTSSHEAYASQIDCVSHGYDCDIELTLGDQLGTIKGKDAVIIGMTPDMWRGNTLANMILDIEPLPAQTWIYYSTESPFRARLWAKSFNIAQMKYHVLMTYDRESEIPIPFGYYRPFDSPKPGLGPTQHSPSPDSNACTSDAFFRNRTGLLSWVSSNCDEVFWPRIPFLKELRREVSVDEYGACGSKQCLPQRSEYCNRLFATYKFFLAIPNTECRDYITEKFWMISLTYGAVPIVLGALKRDYERVAPPNSFIHVSDFENLKELAAYLIRIDQDETLYRSFHEWRKYGEVVTSYPMRPNGLCRTLPHIHPRPVGEFKYLGDSVWYKGCRPPLNDATVNQDSDLLGGWTPWK